MVPVLLFGAGLAVGLGVAALAPGLFPQLARAARPAAKEALKSAIIGYSHLRVAAAEAAEAASDLLAEVEHEMTTAVNGDAAATAPGAAPSGAAPSGEPEAAGKREATIPSAAVAAAAAAAARAAAFANRVADTPPRRGEADA